MTDVKRWNVYSDFEALPPSRQCPVCKNYFTGNSGKLCSKCRLHEEPKKTSLPPTQAQLERINELKDLPEFQEHLDWLIAAIEKGMLNTRGQAGILINEMKKKCGTI